MIGRAEKERIANLDTIVKLTKSNTYLKCQDCGEPLFVYNVTYGMPHCGLVCKKCEEHSPFIGFGQENHYTFEKYEEITCPHCGKKFLSNGEII